MRFLSCITVLILIVSASAQEPRARWTEDKANDWYRVQPWLVGSNFLPASAINQLEMWQAESFDPQEIDRELGWAQSLGMNTMRVFLHDLLWQQDSAGFKKRIDVFLTISSRHHIRPIFVLFDSCWDPFPKLGRSIRRFPAYTTPAGCKAQGQQRWAIPRRNHDCKRTCKV
jgi:hypothetical protein